MQAIVETLTALSGVRQVGVYKNGAIISSNFSDELQDAMASSSEVIAQVFLALESVEKTHNEVFVGINSGYLAGFRLFGGHVILLLTDKKINLPMISMGIKSASEMLKQQSAEAMQLIAAQQNQAAGLPQETMVTEPTHEAIVPVIHQYIYILTEFLGPAASVVVADAVEQWKRDYDQRPNNLTYLLASLENQLDTDKEKQLFKAKAEMVILPDM
ncbi:MAG: hypothetical protein ACPG47_02995 [Leucothrix sp.]